MLKEKNILITGGSHGLGFASAKACLQLGAKVLICARDETAVHKAVLSLEKEGFSHIKGVSCDVTQKEEIEKTLQFLEDSFGQLHGVIHAAGIYGAIGPITEVDPEEWLEGVKTNLFGSFLVAKLCCQRFQKQGGGRIVLFSGGGAASPFPNYTSYACGKAAVVRLSETIAEEMAPYNIEVNCLAPGFVVTRLHLQTLKAATKAGQKFLEKTKQEIEKGGVPAELGASAAAFLVSDRASGISGKFISVPYDSWKEFPKHLKELQQSDLFTLRRIIPKDRGFSWQ